MQNPTNAESSANNIQTDEHNATEAVNSLRQLLNRVKEGNLPDVDADNVRATEGHITVNKIRNDEGLVSINIQMNMGDRRIPPKIYELLETLKNNEIAEISTYPDLTVSIAKNKLGDFNKLIVATLKDDSPIMPPQDYWTSKHLSRLSTVASTPTVG